jgi:hypothetical protein
MPELDDMNGKEQHSVGERELNGDRPSDADCASLDLAKPAKGLSTAKVAANRENSKKSTGPKTGRGKQITRVNSLKHGLFARQLMLSAAYHLPDYQHFEELLIELREQYPPTSLVEELRLEKVAIDFWRLARAQRFEILETCRETAFFGAGVDRAVRYSTLMERVAQKGFDALAQLDTKAADQTPAEEHERVQVEGSNEAEITAAFTESVPEGPEPVTSGDLASADHDLQSSALKIPSSAHARKRPGTQHSDDVLGSVALNEEAIS